MRKILFIILFILLSVLTIYYFEHRKNNVITDHLNSKVEQLNFVYESIYHEYHNLSHVIYETQINTKDVIDILKKTLHSSTQEKDLLRKQLYGHLKEKYFLLKKYGVRQLHFHLPDNRSFLRFHRPEMYGDDLSKVRSTVVYVNKYKTHVKGYENGKLYSGYRFIYPLFDESEEYIGSVEVSFSMLTFTKEIINHFNLPSNFIIKKSVVDSKVIDSEKINYVQSAFDDYYFEKDVFSNVKEKFAMKEHGIISEASKTVLYKNIDKGETFSIFDKKSSNIITFLPIKNPIDEKVIGAISVRDDGSYIVARMTEFYWLIAVSIMAIFLILYASYRELFYRDTIITSNKKLQTVIEEADSGIGVMDLNGNFLEVNQVYSDLLGYSREELLNLSCVKLTSYEYQHMALGTLEKAKKEGKVSSVRKICIRKDGSEINLELSLTLLPSKEAFVAVINSLEETIQLEELTNNLLKKVKEEIEKNKEKERTMLHQSRLAQMGEMISMIAHQWRQPLSAISATSTNLGVKIMLNKYEKELFKEKLSNISEFAQHLSKTIDDFRYFYKPNKEKISIEVEDVFNDALNIIGVSLKNKNIEIKKEFSCCTTITTYPNELKQVALNLIKNAEDALIEKKIQNPIIVLETAKDEEYVYLKVSDNAGGVPVEIIEDIFEAYFTTKGKQDGTGLGLHMSKIIIEDHCDGLLEVKNSNIGAIFIIRISLDFKAKE